MTSRYALVLLAASAALAHAQRPPLRLQAPVDPAPLGPVVRTAVFPIPEALHALPGLETIILSSIQGQIVSTTVVLDFTTVGEFDAALVNIGLQQWAGYVGFSGSELGWSGSGRFVTQFESDGLNGEINFGGQNLATWLMYSSTFPLGGGALVGRFANSAVLVHYVPDCPLDVSFNGVVDAADLNLIQAGLGSFDPELDVTGDGWVRVADYLVVWRAQGLVCPCPQCQ